ncbi:MAG TPA: class I SAM-dependent methyltransferase [Vineibacter sp.]|nr:class I SAM-dependent methyltransferase [Vineibacter sp.]
MSDLAPSSWIARWSKLVPPGRPVLDIAAGRGRHTALLATLGHAVTAIDRDTSALVGRFGSTSDAIRIVNADLEDGSPWPLPGERFGALVVTNYLHRPLFPELLAAIEPGGVLLYETFMVGNERLGRPANPAFLLRDGELLEMALSGGLSVVAYEAGPVDAPSPAVVQRIAARRAL